MHITHIPESVPSPREPLIIQKIAAVGASGDVSKGAHTEQGNAQHLRKQTRSSSTDTNTDMDRQGERTGVRVAGTKINHYSTSAMRTKHRLRSSEDEKGVLSSPTLSHQLLSPDCMCSLPFSLALSAAFLLLPPPSLSPSLSAQQ